MKKIYIIILLFFTACEHKIISNQEINFPENNPIMFKAQKLEVIFDNKQNSIKDKVEDNYSLNIAVEKWVHNRVKIIGQDNKILKVIVKEAKVIKTETLNEEKGIKNLFNKPIDVYKANLEISLEFYIPESLFPANIMKISANCTKSLEQGASVYNRKQLIYDIIGQLITSIDAEFNKNVNIYLGENITYF